VVLLLCSFTYVLGHRIKGVQDMLLQGKQRILQGITELKEKMTSKV
jgi:hypothetical protein